MNIFLVNQILYSMVNWFVFFKAGNIDCLKNAYHVTYKICIQLTLLSMFSDNYTMYPST